MFTLAFWKDTIERVLVTAAEIVLGFVAVSGTGLFALDWAMIGSVTLAASVAALLKAVIASRIGDGSASLVRSVAGRHAA